GDETADPPSESDVHRWSVAGIRRYRESAAPLDGICDALFERVERWPGREVLERVRRVVRELEGSVSSIIQAAMDRYEVDDRGDLGVVGFRSREERVDPLVFRGRQLGKRGEERQRNLVLAKVEAGGFARDGLIGRVVEEVVGDLKRHAEFVTEPRE